MYGGTSEFERKERHLPVVRTGASCEDLNAASAGLYRLRIVVQVISDEGLALETEDVLLLRGRSLRLISQASVAVA